MAVIGIAATLDTKGKESEYLKKCIEQNGHQALLIDTGILYPPAFHPDISREEVFAAAGQGSNEKYRKQGKGLLQKVMSKGLANTLKQLEKAGKIQGILSIGGGQGTAMSTAAMRELPIGFPKVMISTVACGSAMFGDYVGCRDIVMIPSIVDICGINEITSAIFSSGCGAVIGMAEMAEKKENHCYQPAIVLTMAGVTTECVMRVKELLEQKGYEIIVCHTNIAGTTVVDEMAAQGKIKAVIDITTHEISGSLFGGLMAGNPDRFHHVYESGMPVISIPGAADFLLRGPVGKLSEEMHNRKHYAHTPFHTHVGATPDEMYQMGRHLADIHNRIKGENAILIPEKGYSQQNKEGGAIYDAKANQRLVDGVRDVAGIGERIGVYPMHINDKEFAEVIVSKLYEMLCKGQVDDV